MTNKPANMTAYQLVEWGQPARFNEVPVPEPGPDEVRLLVAGVGLCHSDIMFLDAPPGAIPYPLPYTLGHETAGWVEACGAGVDDLAEGQALAVVGVPSCGACHWCVRGHDNYCQRGQMGRGYGEDGGLAPYLVVSRRELVPLATLDPRRVGPITDAGVTSYHAVKKALPKLEPGTTALVIGAGGLGGYAVQYLRLLSRAQVIAVDQAQHRLDFAQELGAHHTLLSTGDNGADLVAQIRELSGGEGCAGVFDFVGDDGTMAMALQCAAHPRHRRHRRRRRRSHLRGLGCAAARVRPVRAHGRVDLRPPGGRRHRRVGRAAHRGGAVPLRADARGV